MPVYERIGQHYDRTRHADPDLVQQLAQYLQIKPESAYLDVACGTGNYTVALADRGGTWHRVDHSSRMIAAARQKADQVTWHVANAEALPYPDAHFSGVLCTLAIHHFEQLQPVFRQVYRVLASGHFVVFTATPEQMRQYWLIEYFPDAILRSLEQMPNLTTVTDALSEAGFDTIVTQAYFIPPTLQDLFLYSGKHQPELYLDTAVRAGISTFALLATPTEIAQGCQQLAADIATGMIQKIIRRYDHDRGDYLFIIAAKSDSNL